MPPSRKRPRHRAAVSGMRPMRRAICLFSSPAAASSTIRALSTTRAGWESAPAPVAPKLFSVPGSAGSQAPYA